MIRQRVILAILAAAALAATGLAIASVMGFKLLHSMDGPGTNGSVSGMNTIALPYNQQTELSTAYDLINDINAAAGGPVVILVARFVTSTDGLEFYTGVSGTNFSLTPGEGYLVQVSGDVNYVIVGTHNPALAIEFDPAGVNGSLSGTYLYSHPYHASSTMAGELLIELNGSACAGYPAAAVQKHIAATDGIYSYDGCSGDDFDLVPGEAYFLVMRGSKSFVPSHY